MILDEPTTGLDHIARRAIWDIIERQKKVKYNKIYILFYQKKERKVIYVMY